MSQKLGPGITVEGPSRPGPARDPLAEQELERLRRGRELAQTGLFAGVALYFVVVWLTPLYAPDWRLPGLVLSGIVVGLSLVVMIAFASRMGKREKAAVEREGPEALAAMYRERRDSARWYAVVGILMLFMAGFSAMLGAGGVLMVAYGAVAYLFWNQKAKQAYDPWRDEELDAWEEEQFGRI